jgi:hypothetical protein
MNSRKYELRPTTSANHVNSIFRGDSAPAGLTRQHLGAHQLTLTAANPVRDGSLVFQVPTTDHCSRRRWAVAGSRVQQQRRQARTIWMGSSKTGLLEQAPPS